MQKFGSIIFFVTIFGSNASQLYLCPNTEHPIAIVDEYISKEFEFKDLAYSGFLKTILDEYGEYIQLESLYFSMETNEDERNCILPYICQGRQLINSHLQLTTQCLPYHMQVALESAFTTEKTCEDISENQCLEEILNKTIVEIRDIYYNAISSCFEKNLNHHCKKHHHCKHHHCKHHCKELHEKHEL